MKSHNASQQEVTYFVYLISCVMGRSKWRPQDWGRHYRGGRVVKNGAYYRRRKEDNHEA